MGIYCAICDELMPRDLRNYDYCDNHTIREMAECWEMAREWSDIEDERCLF